MSCLGLSAKLVILWYMISFSKVLSFLSGSWLFIYKSSPSARLYGCAPSDLKNTRSWPESPAITKPDFDYCFEPDGASWWPPIWNGSTALIAIGCFFGSEIWMFLKSPVCSKIKIWPISVHTTNLPSLSHAWRTQFVEIAAALSSFLVKPLWLSLSWL